MRDEVEISSPVMKERDDKIFLLFEDISEMLFDILRCTIQNQVSWSGATLLQIEFPREPNPHLTIQHLRGSHALQLFTLFNFGSTLRTLKYPVKTFEG